MKLLDRARKLEEMTRSNILGHARRLEAKIQERLQGSQVGDEPLEIWRGIVREIESRIQPVKSGRIFPHCQIMVVICASSEKRTALRAAFETGRFERDIRQLLLDNECDPPQDLSATVKYVAQPGNDWKNSVFHVRFSQQPKPPAQAPPRRPVRLQATLRITHGRASQSTYTLVSDVTYIGRGVSTASAAGSHKNDVVFEDCDDPINSTVSRKHARIVYEEVHQAYVIYDERSARGTSLLRAGRSSRLSGGPRGRRLEAGDQILLGKAVIEFLC
jgi:hypothetical protein